MRKDLLRVSIRSHLRFFRILNFLQLCQLKKSNGEGRDINEYEVLVFSGIALLPVYPIRRAGASPIFVHPSDGRFLRNERKVGTL